MEQNESDTRKTHVSNILFISLFLTDGEKLQEKRTEETAVCGSKNK